MAGVAATSQHWEPSEYAFDPYELTAERLPPLSGKQPAASPDGVEALKRGAAAAAPAAQANGPKRRPGRQKRTSVPCQVPGCGEELVDAKKYYRRYRICQLHCNMQSMMVEGRRSRFCQQCGRFHDIGEFEGAKRSCKRKLKRHNERRRATTSGAKKPAAAAAAAATWQSDSEMEGGCADNACNMTSESEALQGSCSKRPAPAKQKALVRPAPAEQHSPADCSAASLNTGTDGSGSHLAAADSNSQKASAFVAAQARAPPGAAPTSSPSGSLHSSMRRLDAGDLNAAAAAAAPAVAGASRARGASPAVTSAPASPLPADGLATAPSAPQCAVNDTYFNNVLQQLLQDEELQVLQLDPLEMFMPPGGAQVAIKAEPPPPVQQPMMQTQAPAAVATGAASGWSGAQQAVPPHMAAPASLADFPMDLLDDIPLILLPEELGNSRTSAHTSAAASGRSGATVAHTPSTSGASMADGSSLPLRGGAMPWQAPRAPHAQQQVPHLPAQYAQPPAWHMPPGPSHVASLALAQPPRQAPPRQPAPPPQHGSMSSVLASAHSMMSAPSMVAAGHAAPLVGYGSSIHRSGPGLETLACLSLKVFNCTPEQLLPSVRAELESLLQASKTLLEGCIRPGCTHLTVNALVSRKRMAEMQAGGLGALVTDLLSTCGNSDVLQQDMLVQFGGELAVVKRRKVVTLITLGSSPALVPELAPLLPLAVHATADAPASTPLFLRGRNLSGDHDLILARQQGKNLTVEVHASGAAQSGEYAKVRVLGLLPGCTDVEVQRGSFLSAPRALLALPCAAAVAEVRQLERSAAGVEDADALLRDMGLVVQFLQRCELEAAGHPCPAYTPELLAAVAGKAQRLVATAVARGWVATAKMLLPAVTAGGVPSAAAAAAMDACCPEGATLLHVAVGTGSVAMVDELAAWAQRAGHSFAPDAHGARGVTPLHVAALLPNSGDMRAALTRAAPATAKLWSLVQADDGSTPDSLLEEMQAAGAAAAALGTTHTSAAAASCSSDATCEPALNAVASTSKATDVLAEGASSQRVALEAAGVGLKGKAGEGACQVSCTTRRRGRQAMKQHLDDMHMTSIVSEVESSLHDVPCDPRPLAHVLSGTVAAGAALLRALRRGV